MPLRQSLSNSFGHRLQRSPVRVDICLPDGGLLALDDQSPVADADQAHRLEGAQPPFHRPEAPAGVEDGGIADDIVEMLERRVLAVVMLVEGPRPADEPQGQACCSRAKAEIGVFPAIACIAFVKAP